MSKLALTFLSIIIFAISGNTTFAAETDCKPIYGGGSTDKTTCEVTNVTTDEKATPTPVKEEATPTPVKLKATPTPMKSKPTPTKAATTKGGLPIVTPAPATKTPSTGPEILGLIALAPAAALGFYLRKKG